MMPNKLIQILRTNLNSHSERGKLIRTAAGTASLRVGYILIGFLASLLYARVLGPHDYGLYAYVLAWVSILTIPTGLGIPQYLIREGARAHETIPWLRKWADKRLFFSGLIAATLLCVGFFIPQAADARILFLIAAPLPFITNVGNVRLALLQAYGRIVRSQWASTVLAPLFILVTLLIIWILNGTLSALGLMAVTTISAFIPWIINAIQLRRANSEANNHPSKNVQASVSAALPFMWLDALYLINSRIDLILLGTLKGAHDAGIYAVVVRAGELVPFALIVVSVAIGPKVSQLYQENKFEILQRLATEVAQLGLLLTLAAGSVLIVTAKFLLDFFYGHDYATGSTALIILVAAQIIGAAFGPVGTLLDMTKHANLSAKTFGFCAILNFVLNIFLVPKFGIVGSATATAISAVSCCLIRWHLVRRHLNLRSSAIGL